MIAGSVARGGGGDAGGGGGAHAAAAGGGRDMCGGSVILPSQAALGKCGCHWLSLPCHPQCSASWHSRQRPPQQVANGIAFPRHQMVII